MKREQRMAYLKLTNLEELNYSGLCNYCRYGHFSGPCDERELECEHPLEVINDSWNGEHPYDVWQGADCWGFRPQYDLETTADMIGVFLQGHDQAKVERP